MAQSGFTAGKDVATPRGRGLYYILAVTCLQIWYDLQLAKFILQLACEQAHLWIGCERGGARHRRSYRGAGGADPAGPWAVWMKIDAKHLHSTT